MRIDVSRPEAKAEKLRNRVREDYRVGRPKTLEERVRAIEEYLGLTLDEIIRPIEPPIKEPLK